VKYHRKVIQIKAEESPNVIIGKMEEEAGLEPSEPILEGVIDYRRYKTLRKVLPPDRQAVSLDAEFYAGPELKLFPDYLLRRAADLEVSTPPRKRFAKALGVDTAEGGDNTSWTAVDEYGIVDQLSLKTSDTSVIVDHTVDMIRQHGIDPKYVTMRS